jgi:hypothetical protein
LIWIKEQPDGTGHKELGMPGQRQGGSLLDRQSAVLFIGAIESE